MLYVPVVLGGVFGKAYFDWSTECVSFSHLTKSSGSCGPLHFDL